VIPPAVLKRLVGEWAVYDNIEEKRKERKTRGYRGYIRCASSRLMGLRIGGYRITQMAKQEEKQYNNTKFIVFDSGVASS
jgi:hypothetical protein